jgi:AraC-like DNA-binding protein
MSAARMAALELFVGALRSDSDVCSAENVRPALRASIERYIDRHLLDGAVMPAAHWVSIRTVNRVFQCHRSNRRWVVRVRRLARARADVTDSDQPISNIAQRWGFSDTSHFSRTFKAHQGGHRRISPPRPRIVTQRYTDLARGF